VPRARLNTTFLKAVETMKAHEDFLDPDRKGFLVRVSATGSKTFYFRYKVKRGENWEWIRLGAWPAVSPEIAWEKARQYSAQVVMGQNPAKELRNKQTAATLAEAWAAFMEFHVKAKLKPKTAAGYDEVWRNVLSKLGKAKAEEVSQREITRMHHGQKAHPAHGNLALRALSSFFSWAGANGYCPAGFNPAQGVKRFPEHGRMDFMTVPEVRKVLETLDRMETAWNDAEASGRRPAKGETVSPQSAAAIRLLFLTGARMMEILSLRWEDVDWEGRRLNLPDSKTGWKTIPLAPVALRILAGMPRTSEHVFPAGTETAKKPYQTEIHGPWRSVLKACGLDFATCGKRWRIHDARHAFASALVSSGLGLPIVGKILGHASSATTARYAHIGADPALAAAEKAGELLTGGNDAEVLDAERLALPVKNFLLDGGGKKGAEK